MYAWTDVGTYIGVDLKTYTYNPKRKLYIWPK